jgi:3',5'-cyclic AMP phosphodiesterase CpdA
MLHLPSSIRYPLLSLPQTIAHISDLHFGRLDAPVAEALAADLTGDPPTLLVVSGDLTQRARHGQFAAAAEYLKRLPMPQLVVPGNHDVPLWNLLRRFFKPMGRYRSMISREPNPVWRNDRLIVMGINTARSFTQMSGWISAEQIATVQRTLTGVGPEVCKVLVTHHPFIPTPRYPEGNILRGAARSLAELERCGVDVVLAGHLHLAYHDDVRAHYSGLGQSVLAIQAGTAISTRRRGEANSYNRIMLAPGEVHLSVRTWNGVGITETTNKKYQRVDGVWQVARASRPC